MICRPGGPCILYVWPPGGAPVGRPERETGGGNGLVGEVGEHEITKTVKNFLTFLFSNHKMLWFAFP